MKTGRKYLLLFTAAFLLRVLYIFIPAFDYYAKSYPVSFSASEQVSDSETYVKLAKGLLEKGYPAVNGRLTMYGGYVYPLILAMFLKLSDNLIPLILFQALLSSLTCVLLAKISGKIISDEMPGLIGGYIFAFYYPAFMTVSRPLTEPLFTFLLVSGVYIILHSRKERNGYSVYIYAGLIFSAATLTRAMLFYVFFFMVMAYVIYFFSKDRKIDFKILLTVLSFAALQIPWIYLGYVHNGRIILGSTNGGGNLVLGTYIPGNGEYSREIFEKDPEHPIHIFDKLYIENNWTDAQRDSAYFEFSKKQLADNFTKRPFESFRLMFYQISRFWFNVPYSHRSGTGNNVNIAATVILLGFLIYGVFKRGTGGRDEINLLLIFLAVYCLPHALTNSTIRYSFPILPFVFMLSGYGIYLFAGYLKKRRHSTTG